MGDENYRKEMLLRLYDQLWQSIHVYVAIIWQSTGVLVSAFAVFALSEKGIISLDIAVTLIVAMCGWFLANLLEVSFWYNRNLAIIANIEKEFLEKGDLSKIHHYFQSHRPNNKMIRRFKIQFLLGIVILAIFLYLHLFDRFLPILMFSRKDFTTYCVLPYLLLIAVVIYLFTSWKFRKEKYESFIKQSPGVDLNSKSSKNGKIPEKEKVK